MGVRDRLPGRREGRNDIWPMEIMMGEVYWGPRAVIGRLGGSGADPLAGRLRWGGAKGPRRSPRARLRRGPSRAAGPLGG